MALAQTLPPANSDVLSRTLISRLEENFDVQDDEVR